jgi:hypothetical protein
MKNFEDKLREAIDQVTGYDPSKEEKIREILTESFRGKNRMLSAIAWAYVTAFVILAIICAVMFFRSSSERDWILYAALFVVLNTDIVLIKLWFWQRWTRNSVLRELKQMEMRMLNLISEWPK